MKDRRKSLLIAVCLFIFSLGSVGWWLHSINSNHLVPRNQLLKELPQASSDTNYTSIDCPTCINNQAITYETMNSTTARSSLEYKSFLDNTNESSLPIIFMITPTYARPTQKADLTRLCQTLMHVKNLHWIIIEDSDEKTPLVTRFLKRCRVTNTQLNRQTSTKLRKWRKKVTHMKRKNRGAEQRNIGIDWLKTKYKAGDVRSVVYFGDDDNTYDIQLFEEMRYTKKVSIWPVGLAGGLKAEGPGVCKDGKVISWHVGWSPGRKFPVDMAAFAVNLDIILTNPKARLNPLGPGGYLEPEFLSAITTVEELEAKADNCTKVLVWHTQTCTVKLDYENKLPTTIEDTK